MDRKSHINITVDNRLLSWVDTLRGQSPRSTFINHVLSRFYTQTQNLFDWEEEAKVSEQDLRKGRVHKFSDSQKALQWLKS
jgi:hypothetical protein